MRIYLDQNVLGEPIEALIANTEKYNYWLGNVLVAYSDETILEILRSGPLAPRFLNNLSKFETMHLRLEIDQSWQLTGRIIGSFNIKPWERYEHFIRNPQAVEVTALMHKFYGGEHSRSLSTIIADQTEAAMTDVRQAWANLQTILTDEGLNVDISFFNLDNLEQASKDWLSAQGRVIESSLPSNKQENLRDTWRKEWEIDINIVSSFTKPGIVRKIISYIQSRPKFDSNGQPLSVLFGFEGMHPVRKNSMGPFDRAYAVMHFLQYSGYFQDKKIRKKAKFNAAFSDMMHAGIASTCDIFISQDRSLRKRLDATYEYLDSGPRVCWLESLETLDLVEDT